MYDDINVSVCVCVCVSPTWKKTGGRRRSRRDERIRRLYLFYPETYLSPNLSIYTLFCLDNFLITILDLSHIHPYVTHEERKFERHTNFKKIHFITPFSTEIKESGKRKIREIFDEVIQKVGVKNSFRGY